MAQISVGKLLPNLKVTLNNDPTEIRQSDEDKSDELSEKETSDSNHNSNVQIVRSWMESLQSPKIYKNETGGFITGLDIMSENNTEILGKRAERFGLEIDEPSMTSNIASLYESMGLSIENKNSAKTRNTRLDTLHMRGINEMNTNEIFHYFREYGPASVEWINDFSCNVVWLDEASCARALLGVSKPLRQSKIDTTEKTIHSDSDESTKPEQDHDSPISVLDDKQDETEMDIDDKPQEPQVKSDSPETFTLDIPVPPGCWRLGIPHAKAKSILLRFATKDDKKLPGAEKRSDYYKKYGNPNYGGLKGLISSSRKRKMQAAVNKQAIETVKSETVSSKMSKEDHSADEVPKVSKPKPPPRMRMYADDEELIATKKLRPTNISIEKTKSRQSVHSRLGSKYTRDELCQLGSYHRGVERIHSRLKNYRSSDYGRSSSRSTKEDDKRNWSAQNHTDLRTKLKQLKSSSENKHRSPLCIDSESISED